MNDKYMTTRKAQQIYHVTASNLRYRLIRGTLKGHKIDDNEHSSWMVLIEDLDKNYTKRA